MPVSDSDVIAELTASGTRIEGYFLIGGDICTVKRHEELMLTVFEEAVGEEEGVMYYAILDFLRRHGAKDFQSRQEYFDHLR